MRSANLSGDQTHVPKISLQRDTKVDFKVFEPHGQKVKLNYSGSLGNPRAMPHAAEQVI